MSWLGREVENCDLEESSTLDNKVTVQGRKTGYPRPQLRRSNWICLNGEWRFAYDDEGRCVQPIDITDWSHTIEVPFVPESAKSGIGDTNFHANCWYDREFDVPHFGAVDYRARVWVNGQFVIEHEGGHTPFTADITAVLNPIGPTAGDSLGPGRSPRFGKTAGSLFVSDRQPSGLGR